MNIYENNKQLLTTMGGDSANLATDYEVRKAILDLLGGDSSNCNSIYEVDKQILNIYLEGGGGTGDCDLTPIIITENGTYIRDIGGYSEVTVNVEIPECPEIPLTAITINSNGTYIPEEGGYNEVIVDVAGGAGTGGGKTKVLSISFSNDCVDENGTIYVENIDTSNVNNMTNTFLSCLYLETVDVSNWDTSQVTDMSSMFYKCSSLQSLDLSNFDTSKVTSMYEMFYNCISLQTLDVSNWDTSKVLDATRMFRNCSSLQTVDVSNWDTSQVTDMSRMFGDCGSNNGTFNAVGGRTIDEVISGNIGILNGLNTNIPSNSISDYSDRASLRALINGVADRTGQSSLSMSLGSTLKAKLTEEDIAVATAKNWTIA